MMISKTKKIFENPPSRYLGKSDQKIIPYIAPRNVNSDLIDKLFVYVNEGDIYKINEFSTTYKIPLELKNSDGDTLLHVIIRKDPTEYSENTKMKILYELNSIHSLFLTPNNNGTTPLHLAAMYQYDNIINMLCNNSVNVSPKDIYGLTPLHYAVIGYNYLCNDVIIRESQYDTEISGIVSKLLDELNNVIGDSYDDNTRIYNINNPSDKQMCVNTNINVIKSLVKYGANMNAIDNYGMTPLFYALRQNNIKIVEYLLSNYNVSIDKPLNINGETPLTHYEKLYETHLKPFMGYKNMMERVDNFTSNYFDRLKQFTSDNRKFEIGHINELPNRMFIGFSNMIYDYCVRYVPDEIKLLFTIGNITTHVTQPIYDSMEKMNEYNKSWTLYYDTLRTPNGNIFPLCFSTIQQNILQNHPTYTKDMLSLLVKIYDAMNTNFLLQNRGYHENTEEIMVMIKNIISTTLSEIISYNLYREILLIVAQKYLEHITEKQTENDINERLLHIKESIYYKLVIALSNTIMTGYMTTSHIQEAIETILIPDIKNNFPFDDDADVFKIIKTELIPFYVNAYDISISETITMMRGYVLYLMEENQYINMYNLLLNKL